MKTLLVSLMITSFAIVSLPAKTITTTLKQSEIPDIALKKDSKEYRKIVMEAQNGTKVRVLHRKKENAEKGAEQ